MIHHSLEKFVTLSQALLNCLYFQMFVGVLMRLTVCRHHCGPRHHTCFLRYVSEHRALSFHSFTLIQATREGNYRAQFVVLRCWTKRYRVSRQASYRLNLETEWMTIYRKTTTMLFKMLGIERAWAMNSENDSPKPRQLFITQSRVLASKVEGYFSKLMESLATGSYSPRELANIAKKKQTLRGENELVHIDDKINWRDDLPERFSLLEDRHFPLFITFDRVSCFCSIDFCGILTVRTTVHSSANFLKRTWRLSKAMGETSQILHPFTTLNILHMGWELMCHCQMHTTSVQGGMGLMYLIRCFCRRIGPISHSRSKRVWVSWC